MSRGNVSRLENYFFLLPVTFLVRRRYRLVLVETHFPKTRAFWSRVGGAFTGRYLLTIHSLPSGYPSIVSRYEESSLNYLASTYIFEQSSPLPLCSKDTNADRLAKRIKKTLDELSLLYDIGIELELVPQDNDMFTQLENLKKGFCKAMKVA